MESKWKPSRHARTLLCGVAVLMAAVVCGGCGFVDEPEGLESRPFVHSISLVPSQPRAGQTIEFVPNWSGKRPGKYAWVIAKVGDGSKGDTSSAERPRFGTSAGDAGTWDIYVQINNPVGTGKVYHTRFTILP